MWVLFVLWISVAQAIELVAPAPVLQNALRLMEAKDSGGPAAMDQAIRQLAAAAEQAPKDVDAQYQAGVALFYGRLNQPAESAFERVIALDEDHLSARYWLAIIASDLGNYEVSVSRWADLVKRAPDFYIARSNQAQGLQLLGRHEEALAVFQTIVEQVPMDWRSRAKVVQLSQAIGDLTGRDRARDGLLALRKSGQVAELTAAKVFIRDQFIIPGTTDRVLVAEHFERIDPQALVYQFYRQDEQGNHKGIISLGTYQMTTSVARVSGEVGPEERVYHIDAYPNQNEHLTYAFYKEQPSYDLVRQVALEIYAGNRKPVGSTMNFSSSQAESPADAPKRKSKRKKNKSNQ